MRYTAAGAARTVTGSCHHLAFDRTQVVVDCGMFQGPESLERRNREAFPFDVSDVDAVVLTHGHLDHVGRLPALVAAGFRGRVYATRATRAIAEVILRDSAGIQMEDYRRAVREARRHGGDDGAVPPPLYDEHDVANTLDRFRTVGFGEPFAVGDAEVELRPAGHILGSAWVDLRAPGLRVVVSGDLGNRESTLQDDAVPPPACDVAIVETTYADRRHRSMEATQEEFRGAVKRSLLRGGNVLIPSFALERTQQVLYELGALLREEGAEDVQVFLDSPMAGRITDIYRELANEFRPEVAEALERGDRPFDPPTLRVTETPEASKEINAIEGGAVIVAGSGMMTGGRIVHHLKRNLWRPGASVIVVGYQAAGTLGRRLVDGAPEVRILGDTVPVRASIHTINGFSAHADRDDLLAWLEPTSGAHVVLVHGETGVMSTFCDELERLGHAVSIPEHGSTTTF